MPNYDDKQPLEDAIQSLFPKSDAGEIRRMMDSAIAHAGQRPEARILLACLLLSEGDLDRLKHYLQQATMDYRDVLYWAFEYNDEPPVHMQRYLKRR